MYNDSLKKKAINLLQQSTNLRKVARESGLGYEWLIKLSKNQIPDPGVLKIEKLINHLDSEAA